MAACIVLPCLAHVTDVAVIWSNTDVTTRQHADGEILAARAAEKFGIPFTLSTMSICSIEDVAAHTRAPFWFQLYWMRASLPTAAQMR